MTGDTMNPPVSSTVAGDLTIKWGRIVAVTIAQQVEIATHLRELTNPRLLPTRCRLFRRSRVLVARVLVARVLVAHNLVAHNLVARDHVEWGSTRS
ncbi:MAG: hypothetical protein ACLPN1_16195 [Dissulfurispiraceae bacterium]